MTIPAETTMAIYAIAATMYAAIVTCGFMSRGESLSKCIGEIEELSDALEGSNERWREHFRKHDQPTYGGRLKGYYR